MLRKVYENKAVFDFYKHFREGRTKFRLDKSRGKVMLEVFFDYKCVIHNEFIPEVQTVSKELYLNIL